MTARRSEIARNSTVRSDAFPANNKESQAPHHWSFVRRSTSERWFTYKRAGNAGSILMS